MVYLQAGNERELCDLCRKYEFAPPHARFIRIAVWPDGPNFLYRCQLCGALWVETLRSSNLVSAQRARELFPDVELEDSPTC